MNSTSYKLRLPRQICALVACWAGFSGQPTLASPILVEDGHVDLGVVYNNAAPIPLALRLNVDGSTSYDPAEVILGIREEAKILLPAGTPFGNEGEPMWILPQSQNASLLYMGISAEGLGPAFTGPVNFRLVDVSGPGEFFLWQAAQFGALDVLFNTRDGISAEDQLQVSVGSHDHYNWGFSTNGIYRVNLEASVPHSGYSTNLLTQPIAFTFHVSPLPQQPTPFAAWQAEQFGQNAEGAITHPAADPDQDGSMNIAEYAFGTNPNSSASFARPLASVITTNSQPVSQITFPRNRLATDVTLRISRSQDLAVGNWQSFYTSPLIQATGTESTVQISDPSAAARELSIPSNWNCNHESKSQITLSRFAAPEMRRFMLAA